MCDYVFGGMIMTGKNTYSKEKIFRKGEVIYHPVFKEEGKIKKIEPLASKRQKLIVHFKQHGEKKLIAGFSNN